MFQERRQHQRLTPNAPQLVLLDESKYSLLFDLCEGGLAVEGYSAQKSLDAFPLEFDLPEGISIQAKVEIVWTSDSGYRTGFRFVELADSDREQLRAWISGASTWPAVVEDPVGQIPIAPDTGGPLPETSAVEKVQNKEVEEFQANEQLFPLPRSPQLQIENALESKHAALNEARTSVYWAGIIFALALSCVSFLAGYYWRGSRSSARPPQASPPAVAARETTPNSSPVRNPLPAKQPSSPPETSVDEPGFVLQVAAMEKEANADALSASLHQKNFSSFVFKRSSDRFYRVVVGPFPKQEAAVKTRRELEAQGFNSVLRPWSPE